MPLVFRGTVMAYEKTGRRYYHIYVGRSGKLDKYVGKEVVVVVYLPEEVELYGK